MLHTFLWFLVLTFSPGTRLKIIYFLLKFLCSGKGKVLIIQPKKKAKKLRNNINTWGNKGFKGKSLKDQNAKVIIVHFSMHVHGDTNFLFIMIPFWSDRNCRSGTGSALQMCLSSRREKRAIKILRTWAAWRNKYQIRWTNIQKYE